MPFKSAAQRSAAMAMMQGKGKPKPKVNQVRRNKNLFFAKYRGTPLEGMARAYISATDKQFGANYWGAKTLMKAQAGFGAFQKEMTQRNKKPAPKTPLMGRYQQPGRR